MKRLGLRQFGITFLVSLFFAGSVSAEEESIWGPPPKAPVSLYQNADDELQLKLWADFETIKNSTGRENFDARLEAKWKTSDDEKTKSFDVTVQPRGYLRRRTCKFVPLELQFKNREALRQTPFEGIKHSVDLVFECEQMASAEATQREFLLYRIANEVLPSSFCFRKTNITLVTPSDAVFPLAGFLRESKKSLAKRMN